WKKLYQKGLMKGLKEEEKFQGIGFNNH
ncbi:hypothetical protein A2U01_0079273, partial [Trifolium medium]|nr:hypothetical protein [Trifolium medium]